MDGRGHSPGRRVCPRRRSTRVPPGSTESGRPPERPRRAVPLPPPSPICPCGSTSRATHRDYLRRAPRCNARVVTRQATGHCSTPGRPVRPRATDVARHHWRTWFTTRRIRGRTISSFAESASANDAQARHVHRGDPCGRSERRGVGPVDGERSSPPLSRSPRKYVGFVDCKTTTSGHHVRQLSADIGETLPRGERGPERLGKSRGPYDCSSRPKAVAVGRRATGLRRAASGQRTRTRPRGV